MKLTIRAATLAKFIKFLKWGKVAAKLTAIGTALSGAFTALSGSATTGVALGAAGASTYVAAKRLPEQRYEKIKHIPLGGRVDRNANNMLRQRKQGLFNAKPFCSVRESMHSPSAHIKRKK